MQWAVSYDRAADVTVAGLVDVANASYKLANMLQVTGFNHGRAESSSDPTGSAPTPADITTYSAPSSLSAEPHLPSANGGSGCDVERCGGRPGCVMAWYWPCHGPTQRCRCGEGSRTRRRLTCS
jgi:hypothetical protein